MDDELLLTGSNVSAAKSLLNVLSKHGLVGVPPANAQVTAAAANAHATLVLAEQIAMLRRQLAGADG